VLYRADPGYRREPLNRADVRRCGLRFRSLSRSPLGPPASSRPGAKRPRKLKGGYEAGVRFMDCLRLVTRAVSLGDCETLAQHPAFMTHST
jgi:hypothetical protein